jgi:hypothetical protein
MREGTNKDSSGDLCYRKSMLYAQWRTQGTQAAEGLTRQ